MSFGQAKQFTSKMKLLWEVWRPLGLIFWALAEQEEGKIQKQWNGKICPSNSAPLI